MANSKNQTVYHINVGSAYAVLTIPLVGDFILEPADSNYVPIKICTIDSSYTALYNEALRIYAAELGKGTTPIQDLEDRTLWVQDALSFDVNHSGGTWTVTKIIEQDMFFVIQSELLDYLNEKINEL